VLVRFLVAALLLGTTPVGAPGQPVPAEAARAMLARYHEDRALIDRARDLLEDALRRERHVDTLITLARACFLAGDVRAGTAEERLAAYDRGREIGQRAIELAPRSEDAHVWFALNTARWGQTKGVLRSLFLLPTIREELDAIFAANPRSVRGHALAGNVLLELPPLLGGDRAKAQEHFKKGLEADPRFTVLRVDLARAYIAGGRYDAARQELRRVVQERAPTNLADWTVKDRPRARELLDAIKDKR
jgi:tetratricopeptide (TPR) repeat protein